MVTGLFRSLLLVVFALIVLNLGTVEAQPMLYFRNLDVSDGLTSNMISSFAQDSQGFIWIGTRDGLSRFDGLSTQQFFHDPTDSTTMASNFVAWDIKEDADKRIWLTLHGNGFSRYDPATERFTNYNFASGNLPAEWCNHTQNILFASNGQTYVLCNEGLICLSSQDQVSFTILFSDLPALKGRGHVRMATMHDNQLWLAMQFGIFKLNLKDEDGSAQPQVEVTTGVERTAWGISGASCFNGAMWFSTFFKPKRSEHRYLYKFNLKSNRLDSVPIAPNETKKNAFSDQIRSIAADENGNLWLGSEGLGLLNYQPGSRKWHRHNGTDEWAGALLPGSINELFFDRDQNLWIGLNSGISIMAPKRQYFKNYAQIKQPDEKPIPLTSISSLKVGPSNDIWLGKIGDGLIHLDSNKHFVQHLRTLYPSEGDYDDYIDIRYADDDMIMGNVWYDGLTGLHLATGKVTRSMDFMPQDKPELRNVFRARSGQLYGFGWGQFGKLSFEQKTFESFETPQNTDGQPDLIWTAVEDDHGNIWLGMGQRGLICVDPETLEMLDTWERDTAIYRMTGVWKMIHDQGNIYFSLANQGLGVFNIEDGTVKSYSKKDGLCSDEIGGLVKDDNGGIWVYSSSGLSWFDQSNGRFKSFNRSDGMISEKINDASVLSNGNILMISDAGLIEFDPEVLKTFAPTYTPFVKSIQVYDQDINVSEWVEDKETITVPHNGNYLRVEFSALEFIDPEKVKFAYRLEGAEKEWNYSDHKPLAIYTNMAGGNYSLCAKCRNADGVWGEELCIPVFVTTPFYKKAWFILLAIALIGLTVFLVYRWQLRKKLAILEVRNRLSRDLHDDIGSALSSINIYSTVAQQQIDQDKGETKKLLNRMGTSARSMMQSMDDIIWAIDPNNDSADNLTSRMRQFAAPILEAKDIDLKFNLEGRTGDIKLDMVIRRNLFLVFKEAINNAAKYSQGQHVEVNINHSGSVLYISIKDDGIGFDATAKTERHGLKNMKDRVKEMGGEISIISNAKQGTEIRFQIPIT